MYSTIIGTRLAIKVAMYNEEILDSTITSTDIEEVIRWVNGAVGRTTNFTEAELEGDDSLIRLASCKYNACSLMSGSLEGKDVDKDALARIRCEEAETYIKMWCAPRGITPTFPDSDGCSGGADREVVEYAYAVGSDEACIG